jgi:hypothetical protein
MVLSALSAYDVTVSGQEVVAELVGKLVLGDAGRSPNRYPYPPFHHQTGGHVSATGGPVDH